jgi:5-histidylcysteine sulfoxide synthase/putative 4-mercaptohistidine N1-methyltranferase
MHPLRSRSVLLTGNDPEAKRQELHDYFQRTFDIYEDLFRLLPDDQAFYQRPEPLRHPLIFYFGHTATFFVNKLILAKAIPARLNPRFEAMFAIGVDEMSWDDLNQAHYDWPPVAEVRAYRDQVRAAVHQAIDRLELSLPIRWDDHPAWCILMGIEHERIHLETSSVLIRQLDIRWLEPLPQWAPCSDGGEDTGEAPANPLQPVPAGQVQLGKTRDSQLYGWDNEYGPHQVELAEFQASRHLVSNGEYLGFIQAGGYQRPELWTDEGQRWLAYSQRQMPLFWRAQGGDYRLRCLAQEIPMPWNWPVEVNYLEAKAFCNWQAQETGQPIRLPTEEEWYRLHDWLEIADEPEWPALPGQVEWNINLEHGASSVPVDRFGKGGFFDVIGNVWQWTETPIHGFDGFEVHPIYDDFSTPTFDNQHNLIKGGSWISTGNEATRDARYAFRRHFFQHAGFRYVAGPELPPLKELPNQSYETDAAVAQYCEFHYGPSYFGVANFPLALVELALAAHQGPRRSALDLGCAVGRASFELARHFDQVAGIDFSARFIRQAIGLQENGLLSYAITCEGELTEKRELSLEQLGFTGLETKLSFWQGDAHNLKPQFSGYDLVIAANLIDRLYQPQRFLDEIPKRINPGGTLLIASPYTWLEEYTERVNWLGGFERDGRPLRTIESLQQLLAAHFEPIGEPVDLPFVIRETARKYQHSLSQVSLWRRRS